MLTIESALIKDDKRIICKYYEIEEICKNIVKEYCSKSEENYHNFLEFAKNYHTFKPYFDFVVCVLNYKILNPQMEEDKILVGKENHMYVYNKTSEKFEDNFRYGLSDDKTLDVYPISIQSKLEECMIDGNNNHIMPKDMLGHVQILQQILNMLLISHKGICEEYLSYKSDIGYFVQRYLPLIRFQVDKQMGMILARCVYRNDNITKLQDNFINDLLDNRYTYPSFLYKVNEFDKYDAQDLTEEMSYKNDDFEEIIKR